MDKFPNKKYNIIYADPPWSMTTLLGRDKRAGNKPHFKLMQEKDIINLPVKNIADKNCILFLWVVDSRIMDAGEVIKSWGFQYKTVAFTWVKETVNGKDHMGGGVWTRKNPEMCLLATKGKIKRLSCGVRQLQRIVISRVAAKPPLIREKIIELVGDLPRIELFARERAPGWDAWGDEVDG